VPRQERERRGADEVQHDVSVRAVVENAELRRRVGDQDQQRSDYLCELRQR
jgi:hypothetical protein